MAPEKLTRMALADLAGAPWNPRKITTEAAAGLKKSIERFGLVQPIIFNRATGHVVGGHQRVGALRALGHSEADVVLVDLPEKEEKALNVALNNRGIEGEWNESTAALLEEIKAGDPDLFASLRLDSIEDELAALAKPIPFDKDASPDEAPTPAADAAQAIWKVQPGDIWAIRDHRLLCGDCRDPKDVERLLLGAQINLAVTSPPYASQRKYDESSGFKPIHPDKFVEWFDAVQAHVAAHLAADGSWCVNIKEHIDDGCLSLYVKDLAIAHVRKWGWILNDEFCWTHGGTPKTVVKRFKNGWEPIFHFVKAHDFKFRPDAVRHDSEAVPGKYEPGKHKSTAAALQGVTGKIFSNEEHGAGLAYPSNTLKMGKNNESLGHGAAYPVSLPRFFIVALTDPGDLVFDPFTGSGTTMVACQTEGRRFVGTELSPKYCAVVLERMAKLGLQPECIG